MGKNRSIGEFFLILAALIVIVVVFRNQSNEKQREEDPVSDERTVTESVRNTSTPTVEELNEKSIDKATDGLTEKDTEKQQQKTLINEQVIYENNGIILKVLETEINTSGNRTVKIYCENNSEKKYGICAHAYAVNGIMSQNNMFDLNMEVVAGKKSVGSFSIEKGFLKKNAIETIKHIDIMFWVYDDDVGFLDFETEIVRIPTTKYDGTNNVIKGERIYEKNGISVDAVPSSGKNAFDFIISNETNDYIECTLDAVTINDFTGEELSYALIYEMVFSGCQCRFTIQPKEGFLKDCGITQVERIEFRLNIEVNGDYRNEYYTDMMEYNILSGKDDSEEMDLLEKEEF